MNEATLLNEFLQKVQDLPISAVAQVEADRVYMLEGKFLIELAQISCKHINQAQARIKELEKALSFYTEEVNIQYKDFENEGEYYVQLFEDDGYEIPFGTTARNALAKESD